MPLESLVQAMLVNLAQRISSLRSSPVSTLRSLIVRQSEPPSDNEYAYNLPSGLTAVSLNAMVPSADSVFGSISSGNWRRPPI